METKSFRVTELIEILRIGMVALIPVMERAGIAWAGATGSDPWDSIAQGLYDGIVRSCVENIAPDESDRIGHYPLVDYGAYAEAYGERSFLCVGHLRRNAMLNAFVELTTVAAPFDAAVLQELDTDLRATSRRITSRLAETDFELAFPWHGVVHYRDVVTYRP